jgi:hypothetical protein
LTAQEQPRGSREAYERLSDPAMYWTQVNAQPIREPIRRESRDQVEAAPPAWPAEPAQEQTVAADVLAYTDESEYEEVRAEQSGEYRFDDYQRDDYRPEEYRRDYRREDPSADDDLEAREQFGGVNWGAGFFGWLVTAGFAVFLSAALGVGFAVLRRTVDSVPRLGDLPAGTAAIGLATAAVAVVVVAYYAGGYVAGRMSRFDGGRQGASVWVTGLLLSSLGLGVALFFGSEYDLFSRLHVPSVPAPTGSAGLVGLGAAVAALVGSLLAAIGGGKVGCRYHQKVDEYL